MIEIKDYNGNIVAVNEISDIEVGKQYTGGKYISPGYLSGSTLTVVKKGRKNVTVTHPAYHEKFSVNPKDLIELS